MGIISKIKIKTQGRMEAGRFIEAAAGTSFKIDSSVFTGEIREVDGSNVKITKDNQIIASEFREV